MTRYEVVITPRAAGHLARLKDYLDQNAGVATSERFIGGVLDHCQALEYFPEKGTPRDDLTQGLHTIAHRNAVTIVYRIKGSQVMIAAVFYRGRDWERVFRR